MDEDDDDDAGIRAREDGDPIRDRTVRNDVISGAFRVAFGKAATPAQVERLTVASWRMGLDPPMVAMALKKAALAGAVAPVSYTVEVLDDWARHEVRTPEQAEEYQVEYLRENGKDGLYGSGDPAEDYREREEARERRRQENLRAGLVRYG